jgi:O-antigen/teichoic acid export membrane protein
MSPVKVTDWERNAFRTALSMSVVVLVISLIADGISWLISGSRFDKDLAWFILFVFCGIYFTEAINTVHEHLNEIERAVRNNNGEATT